MSPITDHTPNLSGAVQRHRIETLGRRVLTVTRTARLAPNYVRVWLTGDELVADGFPLMRLAVGDHVKAVFPSPGEATVTLPERGPGAAGGPRPPMRDLTVRGYDPSTNELLLEFVLHGGGVASSWAAEAAPGHQLGVLGPRGHKVYPENYTSYLIAGDETAIPAVSRLLEELPDSTTVQAVIEVADEAHEPELRDRPGASVSWVHRAREGDGGLERTVRDLTTPAGDDWFVFAAGEASAVRPLREYFMRELGLQRHRFDIQGYWLKGTADADHHSPALTFEE